MSTSSRDTDPNRQSEPPQQPAREGKTTPPVQLFGTLVSAAELLAALGISAIAVLVAYEVVSRYLFGLPTLWTQDLSIYLLLWAAFLGLAPTERAGEHIRIDLLVKTLPARAQQWLQVGTHLVVACFVLLVAWSGLETALQSYKYGRQSLSLFPVPMWIPQACVPVGMTLMAIECLRRAWRATSVAAPAQ
jgi:C4-dicarboxylate transporter, DctQ subunit